MTKLPATPWTLPPPPAPPKLPQIFRSTLGRPAPTVKVLRPGEHIDNLPITREFVAAVLKAMEKDFVATPGQLQSLAEQSIKYEAIWARLVEWAPANVQKKADQQLQNIGSEPDDVRLQRKEQMQFEARGRRQTLRLELGKITMEAIPIAVSICEHLQEIMADFAKRREQEERAESECFSIAYQPSALLVTAQQASWRLVEELPDPNLKDSPKAILKRIPVSLTDKMH